ncbi:MAG: hypothetical protein ACRCYP_05620, partial [Alphaproteobacteria bacterium]
ETDLQTLAKVIIFKRENPWKRYVPDDVESRNKKSAEKREARLLAREQPMVRADGWVLGRHMEAYFVDRYGVSPTLIHLRNLYSKFSINRYYDPSVAVRKVRDLFDIYEAQKKSSSIRAKSPAPTNHIWGKDLEAWLTRNSVKRPISTIRSRLLARDISSRTYSLIPLKDLKDVTQNDTYEKVPDISIQDWKGKLPRLVIYKALKEAYGNKGRVLCHTIWRSSIFSALKIDTSKSQKIPEEFSSEEVRKIVVEIKKRFAKHP